MTAKITKTEKNQYLAELSFDLYSSTTYSEDARKREAKFRLDGFSRGRVYTLVCICLVQVKRYGFLRQPSIGELHLLLKSETSKLHRNENKRETNLLSVHATINNGPKYTFNELAESNDSWEALIPNNDCLLDSTFGPTGKLDIKLVMNLVGTAGEENALNNFLDMFTKQICCDVRFKFQTGETVGAHIAILTVRSPVFSAMFAHNTKESQCREVEISDIEPSVFKQLLSYVYCGRLPEELNNDSACLLAIAADKYEIEDLHCECVDFLTLQLKTNNVIEIFVWAEEFMVAPVRQAALDYIASHPREICNSVGWEQLTSNYPALCLCATRRIVENFYAKQSV